MYFFGRGVSAFFNQFFKWLFWNKTGQKFLLSILIVVIFFVFIKCGEVAAVEDINEINNEAYLNYESIVNDAIIRLYNEYKSNPERPIFTQYLKGNEEYFYYFYYGNSDGSSYNGSVPLRKNDLYIAIINQWQYGSLTLAQTSNDYMGIPSFTQFGITSSGGYIKRLHFSSGIYDNIVNIPSNTTIYAPEKLWGYTTSNWVDFVQYIKGNNNEQLIELLEDIKAEQQSINEALTNTTTSSDTDSFVDIDSSSVDDLSSASVDNVFSTMTTGFANKFTNYDLSTVNSFVWNLNGTRITFYSDTLYKMIKGTFFETLLSMLWYYIFGHYAFVWLSNIIHKIKDGSILDGLEVNEVITKEML